jgi:hypothetical protein
MRVGIGGSMRNPWAWLVSRFAQKAVPITCGTPHVWAEEQRQAAEWELADKAQSYDGKFYSGDDAKRVMAAWRGGVRKQ